MASKDRVPLILASYSDSGLRGAESNYYVCLAFIRLHWLTYISFGGQSYDLQEQYSDFWALLLPSLQWVRLDMEDGPSARAGHSCTLIGSQLLVIGGWVSEGLGESNDEPAVNLFDIHKMRRRDSFDPDNTVYRTPESLSRHIGGDGHGTSDGSEACQRQYGAGSGYGHDEPGEFNGDSSKSRGEERPTDTSEGGDLQDHNSGTSKGAMGALIFGLVAAIIAVGVGIYFVIRRRRRQQSFSKHQRLASEEDLPGATSILEEGDAQELHVAEPPMMTEAYPPAILQVQPSRPATQTQISRPLNQPRRPGLRWRSTSSSSNSSPTNLRSPPSRSSSTSLASLNPNAFHPPALLNTPGDSMASLAQYETQEVSAGHRSLFPRRHLHITNEDSENDSDSDGGYTL